MRWCWFKVQLLLRLLSLLSTHISWALIIIINCAYFQMWKSYDIFWFWLHFAVSLAMPTMQKGNIFLTCYRLLRGKMAQPGLTFEQIFSTTVCSKTEFADAPTETQSTFTRVKFMLCCCCNEPKGNGTPAEEIEMETGKTLEPEGCAGGGVDGVVVHVKAPPATHWGPLNLKKAPAAINMALWLYRFRITIALIIGNTRQSFASIDPPSPLFSLPNSKEYRRDLWRMSMGALYIDVAFIWFNILQTYCRQCRMCCTVGVCRCVKYTMLILLFGLLLMELPMMQAVAWLDGGWCAFREGTPFNPS